MYHLLILCMYCILLNTYIHAYTRYTISISKTLNLSELEKCYKSKRQDPSRGLRAHRQEESLPGSGFTLFPTT